MTLYREADCKHSGWRATESGHPECLDCGGLSRYVIPVTPDLFVYQQGGLSEAFYRCDKSDADGALFDIDILGLDDE